MSVAVLLALALAAGPPEHGRLLLSADAGGGWASDAYPGAGLGAGAMAELVPGARLDLSLSPRVKLTAAAALSLARFDGADFTARGARAGVEARRLGRAADLFLALGAERESWSSRAPLDALGPPVTATSAITLVPAVRARRGRADARAAATLSWRASDADGRAIERGVGALLAAELAAHPRLALGATLRGERTASAREAFARAAAGVEAGADAAPLARVALGLALRLSLDRAWFDAGARETVARAVVEVAQEVGPVSAVIAFGISRSDRDGTLADRQLVYAGVRGRARALAW